MSGDEDNSPGEQSGTPNLLPHESLNIEVDSNVPDSLTSSTVPPPPYSEAARDIWLLAIFRGISMLGDSLALVALYLRVAPIGHAWAVAGLAIASALPLVVLSPLAGHVVDRVRAKPLLVSLGLGETVVCAGLGLWHSVAATIILMFGLNVVIAFSMPGYSALTISIAGAHVNRAMGVLQSSQGVASVAGPIAGGVLVGLFGQSVPLYVDALSFGLGTVGTVFLRHDRRPRKVEGTPREPLSLGFRHLAGDAILRPVVLNTFVFLLALGTVNVAEVFYVTATLHGSALAYGAIGAAFGLGTIVGSITAGKMKSGLFTMTRAESIAVAVVGVAIGLVGLVNSIGEIYPLYVLAGIAVGVANVSATSLFALRSTESIRGRVFAAVNGTLTSAQLGATVIGGAVLVVISPRTVYQLAGIVSTTTAVVLGLAAIRASRHEESQGA